MTDIMKKSRKWEKRKSMHGQKESAPTPHRKKSRKKEAPKIFIFIS